MRRYLVFLFVGIVLSGCFSYGRDFSTSIVKNIQPNVTTQKEIFGMFGEPVRKGLDSGYKTWSYSYHSYSVDKGWLTKELYIIFNKDGTVQKYSFTSN